ncbi:MAG TPA: DUF222 domain-containing protein [Candidatus Dormibacteraeota bacterium]
MSEEGGLVPVDGGVIEYAPPPWLADFGRAAERCSADPGGARHPGERGRDLRSLRHAMDLMDVVFAREAAAFAATDEYERAGSRSPQDWIRHECRTSGATAQRAICAGEQLPLLPQAEAALREGRIGYAHLTLLASTAEQVRQADPSAPFDEAPLLELAEAHSVSRFAHDCAHARHAADPAGFLADHLDAVEWRALQLVPAEGGLVVKGWLDSVAGATLRTALEPLARRTGAEDTRRRQRRLADALVELCSHALDQGSLPRRGSLRPHLQVTTTPGDAPGGRRRPGRGAGVRRAGLGGHGAAAGLRRQPGARPPGRGVGGDRRGPGDADAAGGDAAGAEGPGQGLCLARL